MSSESENKKEITKNKEFVDDYKLLKFELLTYLSGLTGGKWGVKDKIHNFFRHLEDMIFGKDIDILDMVKL